MKPRSIRVRLTDIRDEISGIRDLIRDTDATTFASSWAMRRAVEHALLIIAEAAKNLPPELKQEQPEIPWRKFTVLGTCFAMSIDGSIRKCCGRLWSITSPIWTLRQRTCSRNSMRTHKLEMSILLT
jgi:hypothetical protein